MYDGSRVFVAYAYVLWQQDKRPDKHIFFEMVDMLTPFDIDFT